MATIPNAVALATIADGSAIVAADHRNNYAALQAFINQLQALLAGGAAGQVLTSTGGVNVGYAAPAAGALSLIFDSVLGAPAASIDTGVMTVAGFKHLMVVFNGRCAIGATLDALDMQFNGDTGNNYTWQSSDGASAGLVAFMRMAYVTGATAPANSPTSFSLLIPDFAGTVFNKMVRSSSPTGETIAGPTILLKEFAGMWQPAAPVGITRIKVFLEGGSNLNTGSRLSVYGMA